MQNHEVSRIPWSHIAPSPSLQQSHLRSWRRGAFVAWEERRFDNEFLPNHNDLRHVRLHNIRPCVNKAG